MDKLLQDLRYAFRLLVKSPGFSAIAVFTLALGIGATTAMFTVVNAVLLSPFPFSEPDQLVMIKERMPKFSPTPVSVPAPDVLTFQNETKSFSGVGGYQEDMMDLTGLGAPRRIQVTRLTNTALPVLGVHPLIGRNFTDDEDRTNGTKVVLLSYRLWRSAFGGDPNVLGKSITLNRIPHTIVGVMPASFLFPLTTYKEDSELWVPMAFTDEEKKSFGDNFDFNAVARLKPGVSLEQAQVDVERVAGQIREAYPAGIKGQYEMHGAVIPLATSVMGDFRQPLLIMMLAVVLVLLIAIANVANLLLARGSSRQREFSVRIALGAGTRRILSQLLTESVVLGIIGGALGIVLAEFGTQALLSLVPANIPRLSTTEVDWRVLMFAVSISVVSGVVFGMAPAWFARKLNVNDGLKESGRSGTQGRHHRHLRTAFVVAQFSLALVLLVGAGLLIRSFQRVLKVDPGFQPDHVISGALSLPRSAYKEPPQRKQFYQELMRRLAQVPAVKFVGGSTDLPLESTWTKIFSVEGQILPPGGGFNVDAHTVVLGDYFQTMGIPLVRGRLFNAHDTAESTKVVLISKGLAERYFHGQDPIGHRIKWGPPESDEPWLTIVGVVGDVKQEKLDSDTRPHTYESYLQYPGIGDMKISARTQTDSESVVSALQAAVHSLDQQLPVTEIRTMDDVISDSTAARRFYLVLAIFFAASAIVLASVGLYGVVAFAVEQRTREIGIRMTLGATQWNVMGMLLRWSLLLAGAGIIAGAIGAFILTRLLSGFLFNVRPDDPLTFVSVAVLLALISLLAAFVPARRAARVDPMVALRSE